MTHLYASNNFILRVTCAKLRALAENLDYSGSISRRHVLPTPMLRQQGGSFEMAPVPHESLSSNDGRSYICHWRGERHAVHVMGGGAGACAYVAEQHG